MQRSADRILTTHAGSLPRPGDLLQMMRAKSRGEPVDEGVLAARVRSAVAEIVRKQVDLGIDVIDDGELGKPSFVTYVRRPARRPRAARGAAERLAAVRARP